MLSPSRLAAAAVSVLFAALAASCTTIVTVEHGRPPRAPRPTPPTPLQIASADPVAPVAPGFLRCDGVPLRLGDTLFCFDEVERTFGEAEDHCKQMGGHLARIRSAAQSQSLISAFGAPVKLPPSLWLGLVEPFKEGDWGWMSGKRTSYVHWQAGEPNDAGAGEDCGEWITSTGGWNDIDCAAGRAPLCEGPAITAGGANAFTCTGGIFVQAGATPYCLYPNRMLTSSQADAHCRATGGRLAEPSAPEKDQALFAALRPRAGTGADIWIGFTDSLKEGDWRSVSGEPAAFAAWRPGEPNNVGPGGENCASWGPTDGGWNDLPCDHKSQSLCEGPAEPAPLSCGAPLPFTAPGCTNVTASASLISASTSIKDNTPDRATDGDCTTVWNAGGGPSQFWQVQLEPAQDIRGVTLVPEMTPATAAVVHDVSVSADGQSFRTMIHYEGVMTSGQVYPLDFGSTVKARYVRVTTVASPSWVAWQEIAVFRCP